MELLAFLPALLFGAAIAVQSPTNASLATKTGSMQATLFSFTSGLALICILVPLFGHGSILAALQVPKWQLAGGLYAAAAIFGMTRVIPYLGAALSSTLLALGELSMGMLIDWFGWLTMDKLPMNAWRIAGIATLTVGILLVYLGKRDGAVENRNDGARIALCAVAIFAIGLLAGMQAPTNAVLSRSTGYLEATFYNFAVAWVAVLLISLMGGKIRLTSFRKAKPWELLGGVYSVVGVVSTAIATSILGAGLMVALATFAQLALSVWIDTEGWLGCKKIEMNPLRGIGVAVIAVGIFFTAVGRII